MSMAPKRKRAPDAIDLTVDDETDAVEEAPVKRRRASGKRRKAVDEDVEEAQGASAAAGPSQSTVAAVKGASRKGKAKVEKPVKDRRVDDMGRTAVYRPNASQDVCARIQRAMPGKSFS